MSNEYDFYIILGCFGLRIEDFVCCASVENIILKVDTSLPNYNEMMDYYDQCRLFDRPMFDANAIRHVIFNMQDRYHQVIKPLWSVKKFELYQKFLIDHRHCGLFLRAQLPGSQTSDPSESESPESSNTTIQGGKLRLVKR